MKLEALVPKTLLYETDDHDELPRSSALLPPSPAPSNGDMHLM